MRTPWILAFSLCLLLSAPSLAAPFAEGASLLPQAARADPASPQEIIASPGLRLPPGISLDDLALAAPAEEEPKRTLGPSPGSPPALPSSGAPACPEDHLTPPVDCTGFLSYSDQWQRNGWLHFYTLHAGPWVTLNVSLEAPEGAVFRLCLGNMMEENCVTATGATPANLVREVSDTNRTTLLVITDQGSGSYHLRATARAWTLTPDCGSGADAPNDLAGAMATSVPGACTGSLNPRDDPADWYRFDVPAGAGATLALDSNPEADFDVCVFPVNDTSWPLDCSIEPRGVQDRTYLPSPGAYFAKVEHWSGAESYAFSLSTAPLQNDCGTGADAGSRYQTVAIALAASCAGALAPDHGDAWDLYAITVADVGGLRLQLASTGANFDLCLYRPHVMLPVQCSFEDGADEIAFRDAYPGRWLVSILGFHGGAGTYALETSTFLPAPQDDCATARDAGDVKSAYLAMEPGTTCAGRLSRVDGDWQDGYLVSAPPGRLTLTLQPSAAGAWGLCLGIHGDLDCDEAGADGVYRIERETYRATQFTVRVYRTDAATGGTYDLAVHAAPPTSDCGTGADAGRRGQAAPFPPTPARCAGVLQARWGDTEDAYRFHVGPGQSFVVQMDADPADNGRYNDLCVYGDGAAFCAWDCMPPCDAPVRQVERVLATPGDWYVVVHGPSWRIAAPADAHYNLTIAITPTLPAA